MAKKIKIVLTTQRLIAIEYSKETSKEIFNFPCITGDSSHLTPTGNFKILRKERVRRSGKYNAQMNYALQITGDGIFIHESYNYITNPKEQSFIATAISDTAATIVSHIRAFAPSSANLNVSVGDLNMLGSHGCIRLAHSDALRLFDWAEEKNIVEIVR